VVPPKTLKLLGTVEAVLEWGFSASSVLDPEKCRSIGQALLLTRCLRFELQRPEHQHRRKVAAATQGDGKKVP